MIAEQQLRQEARRVLRKLSGPRQYLFARGDRFVMGRSADSRSAVAGEMVQAFARLGWIAPDGEGRHVIAPAGRDFLARESGGFAAQHQELVKDEMQDSGAARSVTRNMAESPLARLKMRGLLDATQFAAGEKLRRDFEQSQIAPRMGVNWDSPVVSGARGAGADGISDIALMARQRLNMALAATGPGLSDLLFDVCCHLSTLEAVESARGWAKSAARVVLKIALDRLAMHYGMGVVSTRTRLRAWSAEEPA